MVILFVIFEKGVSIIQQIILPVKDPLPEKKVLGLGILSLLSLFLLLGVSYGVGSLAENQKIKNGANQISETLELLIPGYSRVKV